MIAANNQPAPADREHGKFISRSCSERNQISLAEVTSHNGARAEFRRWLYISWRPNAVATHQSIPFLNLHPYAHH